MSVSTRVGAHARSMAQPNVRSFGRAIRTRRLELDLTQEQLARGIEISVPYVGHLEAGKRHPSEKVVLKVAEALGLDRRELFLLANPGTTALISEQARSDGTSAWKAFCQNSRMREIHSITDQEMQLLSKVAMMGEVRKPGDFLFILNTVRMALC
jgi:transcriptional regulator with XRE-family HTH domain